MDNSTPGTAGAARKACMAAVVAVAALGAQQAQAGLVYTWVTTAFSPTIWAAEGRMELSAALWPGGTLNVPSAEAVQQGGSYGCVGASYVYPGGGFYPECEALVGVENFYFNVNNRQPTAGLYFGSLKFRGVLTANGADPLTGWLFAESGQATNLLMRSAPGGVDWRVEFFQSDIIGIGGNGCYNVPQCFGATGRWVLDPSSIPVPEPGTLALVGIALVGVAAGRRRPSATPAA